MFHPEKEAKIFKSSDDLKEAGPGWVDSPEKFGADQSKAEPVKAAEESVEKAVEPEAPAPRGRNRSKPAE